MIFGANRDLKYFNGRKTMKDREDMKRYEKMRSQSQDAIFIRVHVVPARVGTEDRKGGASRKGWMDLATCLGGRS